jgi:hypothetical protein
MFQLLKKNYLVVIVVLVTLLFIAGVLIASIDPENKQTSTDVTLDVSSTLVKYEVSDLINKAGLIVEGTVVKQSEAFQIKSPAGAISNHTDYTISVDSVLRGQSDAFEITIRLQGGVVGDYTENHDSNPEFNIGSKYLLFLYKAGQGGAFNTLGDYYYVLGEYQGVYDVLDTGDYVAQKTGEPLTLMEMQANLDSLRGVSVDERYFREQFIDNQRKNLASGFITQQEYDEMMQNIDIYAEIIE